jgi:uncharacterized protein YcfJ
MGSLIKEGLSLFNFVGKNTMNTEVKKIFLLISGAIFMIVLGAWGMWVTNRIISASTIVPVTIPTPPPLPTEAPPTQTIPSLPEQQPAPAQPASASPTPNFALAKVIRVVPHYITRSIPYHRCYYVCHIIYERGDYDTSGAGALIGGVAGGLAGNQIGAGNGRIAATIGGSILGALVGNQMEENVSEPRPYRVCHTVCHEYYSHQTIRDGYRVTYSYNGQEGSLITKEPPTSDTVPLSLTPVK